MDTTTFAGEGRELGIAIGRHFAASIQASLAENSMLHNVFRPYHDSATGQALHAELMSLHRRHYPGYLAELEGLAHGAQVDATDLFLVNLRGEYRGYTGVDDGGECSTCAVVDAGAARFGHNEDGAAIYRGRSYLIRIEPPDRPAFVVLCYPGFLPGNAFGFNEHGVCFSVNNVRPKQLQSGLGRHFLSRSLFEATGIGSAIARLQVTPRAAGFNYTIGSVRERRIVNVEVSPRKLHVHEVRGWHFHANHYLYLDVPQHRFASSVSRQQRGDELLSGLGIGDTASVTRVLRDRSQRDLPIWRDGSAPDRGVTLLSAVFDLDEARFQMFPGPLDTDRESEHALVSLPMGAQRPA